MQKCFACPHHQGIVSVSSISSMLFGVKVMSGNQKSTRANRKLKLESLERRELMASDVTASLSGGTLQIRGSDQAEHVIVDQFGQNITVRIGNATPFATFAASQVNNLRVQLNGGDDRLNVNLQQKNLDSVSVDMGRGSNENVDLKLGRVRSVNVNAIDSLHTRAILAGNIQGRTNINFGTDSGMDTLFINNSTLGTLEVQMGGGIDELQLRSSRIDRVMIDLGAGDDVLNNVNSEVSAGSIDGGSSIRGNRLTGSRLGSRVAIRGF